MNAIDPHLRVLVEAAATAGIGMDDIEHDLLDPANLAREDHDALWLFALGRRDCPRRSTIDIVSGG
jgi:hypothetical protein